MNRWGIEVTGGKVFRPCSHQKRQRLHLSRSIWNRAMLDANAKVFTPKALNDCRCDVASLIKARPHLQPYPNFIVNHGSSSHYCCPLYLQWRSRDISQDNFEVFFFAGNGRHSHTTRPDADAQLGRAQRGVNSRLPIDFAYDVVGRQTLVVFSPHTWPPYSVSKISTKYICVLQEFSLKLLQSLVTDRQTD